MATAREQQSMGGSGVLGQSIAAAAAGGGAAQHPPAQAQLPPAEPPLTRAQLDARFEKVEQEARARRQEAAEDARERRHIDPAGTVRRRLLFD